MYNANNYGYNPYGTYIPPRPVQQPMQPLEPVQPQTNAFKLQGKQVDSIEVVRGMDIPLDGTISYFPIADGSSIVSKQLQMDGTSKIQVYKLANDTGIKETKYITEEEFKKGLSKIDLSEIEELKEEIKEIKKTIKDLKKKGE